MFDARGATESTIQLGKNSQQYAEWERFEVAGNKGYEANARQQTKPVEIALLIRGSDACIEGNRRKAVNESAAAIKTDSTNLG